MMARRELWNETGQWNDRPTPKRPYKFPGLSAKQKRASRIMYPSDNDEDLKNLGKKEGRKAPQRARLLSHEERGAQSILGGAAVPSDVRRRAESRGAVKNSRVQR